MRVWNLFIYAMKNMTKFEGRACRMEAISFLLVVLLVDLIGFLLAFGLVAMADSNSPISAIPVLPVISIILFFICLLLLLIFNLAIIIPSISLTCRRLHDLNVSGWLQLIAYIPIISVIGFWVLLVMEYFIPGTEGPNNYGPVSENY